MSLGLQGRVALVTGAASGIGRATARLAAREGCRVALLDISAGPLAEVARELGSEHRAFPGDLADTAAVEQAVAEVIRWAGRLDILINAGAVLRRQTLSDVRPLDFDTQVSVNMRGPFFLARAAAAHMQRLGWGRIVLLASHGAFTGGYVSSSVYSMTKAAVVTLAKSMARELAAAGVTVNAVAPGPVDTPMLHNDVSDEALKAFATLVPMGRFAAPEEIARGCLFLASDWAGYITGHCLDINGGMLMR
ncbi:MAG: SDR family oxidoreductase [Proteobacteria bacterium]|nr:SDR family oxidoreductase [Pseudomonadota bacterium]